jgi:hypothetical protein
MILQSESIPKTRHLIGHPRTNGGTRREKEISYPHFPLQHGAVHHLTVLVEKLKMSGRTAQNRQNIPTRLPIISTAGTATGDQ